MMKTNSDSISPLNIFLSHASNDRLAVRELYQELRNSGFDVWLDEERILPGQDWNREITRAVRASDVVIVCLSNASISKVGFVQKEIKMALDVANQFPEGTYFLIPVKLEECEIPSRLHHLRWINLFETNGYKRLERSLVQRSKTLVDSTTKPDLDYAESLQSNLALTHREMVKLEQEASGYSVLTLPVDIAVKLDEIRKKINHLEVELSKYVGPPKPDNDTFVSFRNDYDIFLSYSRKDADIMIRVKIDLEKNNFIVWVDETELELGTVAWEKEIQDVLERSRCLIALMTPDSKNSTWVLRELSYAERHNVRIFPVLARGNDRNAVPVRLSSTMWVDIRSDYTKALNKLVLAIRKQIGTSM